MAYFVNGNDIFKKARKEHYAVGAYNTNNLEWTRALLRGAEETRTPLLIQVSTGAAKYMGGYKLVKDLVEDSMDAMDISVPVILNLDHGDYDSAVECIKLGYSSVMFDGHALPTEENLAKTKEIIKLAHERGISVEAEIGRIGENQGAGELASVEDAKAFVAAGVDKLACGIGNIHGVYPEGWSGLNFDRLKEIAEAVPETPLVCTVVQVFLKTKSKRQFLWVSQRSTSTLNSNLHSKKLLASTSKKARTKTRARRVTTHVSCSCQVLKLSLTQ